MRSHLDNGMWLSLMVKDKYARDCERDRIKHLVMELLSLEDKDVFYVPFDVENPYSYYVFVRERNCESDLHDIFSAGIGEFLTGYRNQVRISGDEFKSIVRELKTVKLNDIRFGDFVKIKRGIYSGLYGIVLRQSTRKNCVCVGMKFCFGIVVEEYPVSELECVGNLFNYVKVLD